MKNALRFYSKEPKRCFKRKNNDNTKLPHLQLLKYQIFILITETNNSKIDTSL